MADTNIKTQISRLSGAKSDLATAITAKGVTVPDDTTLDGYAALVEQIDTGVDTSDADATAGEILSGKTAYVDGCKVTGTMTNKGKITANLVPGQTYTIPEGYHSGEGTVTGVSYRKAISYTKTLASGSNDIASYVLPEADYAISVFVKPYSYKSTATIGILCSELDKKADDGTLSYTKWDAGNGILNQTAEGTKLKSIHLYAGTDDMPSIKVTATASAEVLAEVGVYISRVGGNAALTVNGTDTSDATATAANILSGKTAYVDGAKLTGTMTNNGAVAKTMTANGVYAMSAVTALTAQNTTGVTDIFDSTPHFLAEQLDAVFTDIFPDAVKIGMVSSAELIETIAAKLKEYGAKHIVVDPVMVATSGAKLLRDDAVTALCEKLLPLAEVLTPNIPEAEILSGMTIQNAADMERAAQTISEKYGCAVLCKGGHQINDADDLLWRDGAGKWFKGRRIDNPNTHGTGCTLSSAIASNLAKGYDLDTSVERAKAYISGALAAMLDLGHGSGPMNHMFALKGDFVE